MIKVEEAAVAKYPLVRADLQVGKLYENHHGSIILIASRTRDGRARSYVVLRPAGEFLQALGNQPLVVLPAADSRYRLFDGVVTIANGGV